MIIRTTASNCNVQPSGLYVHQYALELMRTGTISPRAMLLLAHVDAFISPFKSRSQAFDIERRRESNNDVARGPMWLLRDMLHATDDTVHKIIADLTNVRPKVFAAKQPRKGSWLFKTRPMNSTEKGGLLIPPTLHEDFRLRKTFTIREMLVLSIIASFQRNGRQCYCYNDHLAEHIGVKEATAANIVSKLVKNGSVTVAYGRCRTLSVCPCTHDGIPLLPQTEAEWNDCEPELCYPECE